MNREIDRCRREVAAIEVELLAGNPKVEGLCLALADWSAELRILQNEERRRAEARRRDVSGMEELQASTEYVRSPSSPLVEVTVRPSFLPTVPERNGMREPTRRFHQLLRGDSARPLQQFQNLRGLAAIAGLGLGSLGDLAFLRALGRASVGLFGGFGAPCQPRWRGRRRFLHRSSSFWFLLRAVGTA
jgi:hypothetical protein